MFSTGEAIVLLQYARSLWALACRLAAITAWWIWWILVGLF